MDPSFAESVGVDTEKLLISRPDSAENLLSMVNTLTKSGSIDVIVVDSVSTSFCFQSVAHILLFLSTLSFFIGFFYQVLSDKLVI